MIPPLRPEDLPAIIAEMRKYAAMPSGVLAGVVALQIEDWADKLEAVLVTPPHPEVPKCPRCGSDNGSLGTQFAYFVCRDCKINGHGAEQYWTPEHGHPNNEGLTWQEGVLLSPWGRLRWEQEHAKAVPLPAPPETDAQEGR